MPKILIADPDPFLQDTMRQLLLARGHEVAAAPTAEAARERLAEDEPALLIAALELPGMNDLDLLQAARRDGTGVGVILTAAFGSVADAVRAVRAGADDFLPKPFSDEQLVMAVDRAFERAALRRENLDLRHALDDRVRIDNLIGGDPRMQAIFKTARAVADTRTTVLITGESGTGKTLLARALHAMSARRNGPFTEVNCGAMPETLLESELFGHVRGAFTGALRDKPGKFEAAHGGTIFLDEIGTSSPAFQVKLLRVLQDRVVERVGDNRTVNVDVRIVLATNLDLEEAVRAGRFREDLYYRIHVVAIEMPPLRDRPGDVPDLARHFLGRFAREHAKPHLQFTPAALQALQRATWPGNVRQLENVVERTVVFATGRSIDVADLPPLLLPKDPALIATPVDHLIAEPQQLQPLKEALGAAEKRILERTLQQCSGNRERAAKALGINRSTLFAKLRRHGVR
jgi:DNA-binding NtrC family response regulator